MTPLPFERRRRLHLSSSQRPRGRVVVAACTTLACLVGCVRWQTIPPSQIAARPLPRWVQVTTTDSARFVLERAHVLPGDTLTGRSSMAADSDSPIRIPGSRIAHLEARVPSGPGSIGVAVLVVGGLGLFVFAVGHAAGSSTP